MDYFKKESSQTTESFTQRTPLGEKNNQNLPYVSQIQELMSILVQKKAQLKDAKLKQANLLGKEEQQQIRISKIKISIDHEIQKEQMTRCQQQRFQQQIKACKQSIKELTRCMKTIKSELGQVLEEIITAKKSKLELENLCGELQFLVQGKTSENMKIDQQIQNLETLIISAQNDVRSKQDELTNLQLQKTDLSSLINFLEQKLKLGIRAKNNAIAQGNESVQLITKTQQKIYNIKRETNQVEWSCQQIRSQNSQIEDLNQRLESDLQSVRKHLMTMEKMNQVLQNSLAQYGITGDKVTRLINTAKNHN